MNVLIALGGPVLGIVGVIAGSLLNEYLRRGRRAEQYSAAIFSKRLEAYETLFRLVQEGSSKVDDAVRNCALSTEERHDLASSAIMPIANHVDRYALYIDEELGPHCVALFMGVEDICDAPESERESLRQRHFGALRDTYRMIKEDVGVAQINKLFRSINRPRITSPVIEAIREMRRNQGEAS